MKQILIGNDEKFYFDTLIFEPNSYGDLCENIKIAKNLLKSSPTDMNVLELIMLQNNGNVDKKF